MRNASLCHDVTMHTVCLHDDVIKWKHFPRHWPLVWGNHRSPVNSPHKGQWRGTLMFSLICARINGWVNNGEAGDLRRHRAHYDVIVMMCFVQYILCCRNYLHGISCQIVLTSIAVGTFIDMDYLNHIVCRYWVWQCAAVSKWTNPLCPIGKVQMLSIKSRR